MVSGVSHQPLLERTLRCEYALSWNMIHDEALTKLKRNITVKADEGYTDERNSVQVRACEYIVTLTPFSADPGVLGE